MDPNVILSKCVTLLYRESQIENPTENSADLIKTILDKVRVTEINIGANGMKSTPIALRDLVYDMCNNPIGYQYELLDFLQQIRIITNNDEALYKAIAESITEGLSQPNLKRLITNLRKVVGNYYREQKIADVVNRAHLDLCFSRHKIPDITQYIRNLIIELEATATKSTAKDPAIIKSFDLSDDATLQEAFNDAAGAMSDELVFKTGWRELNEALQGGMRPGDAVVIGALQHNYKTGLSLSLFAHMALYNKPRTKDPNKKPLLYRVTLEDPIRNNAQFLYQLLKHEETKQKVQIKGVDPNEMVQYVKTRLSKNGYRVLIEEVNPNNWTTSSLINRIIELESQGYKIEVLSIDYLSKIPTNLNEKKFAIGDDVLEQLSQVRAFCSA